MSSVQNTPPGKTPGPQLAPVERWFHYKDGFYFVRRTDASVSIEQWVGGSPKLGTETEVKPLLPVWRLHLDLDSWISVIGSMSKTHSESFDLPYQFHMGVKPHQIVACSPEDNAMNTHNEGT